MQTAIVSDLHLGGLSGRDLLRDPAIQAAFMAEIAPADRLVLLGDALELFELPLEQAFAAARPFFEQLGEAMVGRPVLLVPGNHDHRLARPLLRRAAATGEALGLEQRCAPSGWTSERLAEWLGDAELELAYPGVWLREDVYATHGHYIDCHRGLPRLECIAAASLMRARPLPPRPTPGDYERVLAPIYRVAFRLAQAGVAHRVTHPSEQLWRVVSNGKNGNGRRIVPVALRSGVPAGVRVLNRVLHAEISADLAPGVLSETGIAAATELARRLEVDAAHMITGHTHRAGPGPDEAPWLLPGGGRLHNTGSWIFTSTLRDLGSLADSYLPGVVTWLGESGPPRRVYPLGDSREQLRAVASQFTAYF